MSFVHLHTHSEYSLLDGANRLPDLIRRAMRFEMPALALTDHGCLYGAWTFQKLARKEGLKPIIGMEAYVAPGDRRERARSGQGGKAHYHLVLLARDGGYASKANLEEAKELGVRDVVFHQKRGIAIADMASSPKVYGRLRNFRAGMEAVVSYLKRCFGLRRCNWRGLEHFRSYVWSSVVTHNLWVIARHKLKPRPA